MNLVQIFVRVFALLGPEGRLGWQLAVGNILLAIAQFAEPVLLGRIVDALIGTSGTSAPWSSLEPLVGGWVGLAVIVILCGGLIALYAGRLAHRRRQVVLADYFAHILQLPPSERDENSSSQTITVMLAGADALWAWWLAFFREHLAAFVSLLVLLPLSLLLNWQLAAILIALAVVFAIVFALVLRETAPLQGSIEDRYADLAERSADALGNVALVQSFNRIDVEVAALRDSATRMHGAQMPALSLWALATVITRSATIIAVVTTVVVGIWLHLQGLISVGGIIAFVGIAALVIGRLEQAVGFSNGMVQDLPHLRAFFGTLDLSPPTRDRLDAFDPGRLRGLVEFKDVSYSYDGKHAAVADLNFTALPGQTIALVGETGAGKATAMALLHRAFDPQSGAVTIDGMDVRGIALAALRRNIGVMFREPPVFNRSILENLLVGKPDATEEEIRTACERAQATDLIERDDKDYAACVAENAQSLSRDQRQRLAIARIFLKDPPILILDESAGSLDATTDARFQTAIDEVVKERTTFIIARRLATLRAAQSILMFEKGRVIETGVYKDLVRQDGKFAKLAKTHFKASPRSSAPKAADVAPNTAA